MPSRCVVQGCSNKSAPKQGISLHLSPLDKAQYAKWRKFVLLHRKNFNPEDRFAICSKHFEDSCFSRLLHQEGSPRRLIPEAIPTIWQSTFVDAPNSARDRRKVSCQIYVWNIWCKLIYKKVINYPNCLETIPSRLLLSVKQWKLPMVFICALNA